MWRRMLIGENLYLQSVDSFDELPDVVQAAVCPDREPTRKQRLQCSRQF